MELVALRAISEPLGWEPAQARTAQPTIRHIGQMYSVQKVNGGLVLAKHPRFKDAARQIHVEVMEMLEAVLRTSFLLLLSRR